MFIAASYAGLGFSQPSFADDTIDYAVRMEMNSPSSMTTRADRGLFTSIARVGNRLVAVGERGRILLSDNNGQSWRQVETPTRVTLTQVRFASATEGWAIGQMGIVLHTQDGGLTWVKQFDGLQAGQVMLAAANADISAHGNNTATAANLQAAQQTAAAGPNVPFLTILPVTSQNLLLAGAFGMAFSSTDGGISWRSIADNIPDPSGLHIYDLVQNDGAVFATGEQGLVLSGSFGGAFSVIATPFQGSFFGALTAPDQSLLVYGLQGTILRSIDGGKAWTQPVSNVAVGIDCGIALQDGGVLLGDIAGDLLLSHDDGKTFAVTQAAEPVVSVGQAADGSIIIAGPLGLERISVASLNSGA